MKWFSRHHESNENGAGTFIAALDEDGWPVLSRREDPPPSDPLTALYEDGMWCVESDLEEVWNARDTKH